MMNIVLLALSEHDSLKLKDQISTLYPAENRFISLGSGGGIDLLITRSIYIDSPSFMKQMMQFGILEHGRLLTIASTLEEKASSEAKGFPALMIQNCTVEDFNRWFYPKSHSTSEIVFDTVVPVTSHGEEDYQQEDKLTDRSSSIYGFLKFIHTKVVDRYSGFFCIAGQLYQFDPVTMKIYSEHDIPKNIEDFQVLIQTVSEVSLHQYNAFDFLVVALRHHFVEEDISTYLNSRDSFILKKWPAPMRSVIEVGDKRTILRILSLLQKRAYTLDELCMLFNPVKEEKHLVVLVFILLKITNHIEKMESAGGRVTAKNANINKNALKRLMDYFK